ncbi:hypothetical protein [Rhizobium sp. WYJ-E13]|uniref:hypothetical protein n=1 Tax=Rhizobium sp. WYJ-E13 TaxID=2849093 RepID=UPI001C1EB315|nr:hypothetical protein [Rhizobium sp. WYJ-E13]QWW72452.1 hypothetical protein KQ933_31495 [Rhizobium sp. WYJ-E13]
MPLSGRSGSLVYGFVAAALIALFLLEVLGPFDVMLSVLYIPVIVYTARTSTSSAVICVGLICAVLSLVSFLITDISTFEPVQYAEFTAVMVTIAATTLLTGTVGAPALSADRTGKASFTEPRSSIWIIDDTRYAEEIKMATGFASAVSCEIRLPLSAAELHAHAGLRWLNRAHPDLERARDSFARIIQSSKKSIFLIEQFDRQRVTATGRQLSVGTEARA